MGEIMAKIKINEIFKINSGKKFCGNCAFQVYAGKCLLFGELSYTVTEIHLKYGIFDYIKNIRHKKCIKNQTDSKKCILVNNIDARRIS